MTRVTIDLDVLRATMPKHPTWPTPGDTTDPKEADAVFASLAEGWILGAQAEDKPLKGRLIDRIALAKMPTLCGHPDCGKCWGRLSQWLETSLFAPESDKEGQGGATVPLEPETGTQRPWPPPTPDMHESELDGAVGPDCVTTDCRDCPTDCEYTVARLWADEELAK